MRSLGASGNQSGAMVLGCRLLEQLYLSHYRRALTPLFLSKIPPLLTNGTVHTI